MIFIPTKDSSMVSQAPIIFVDGAFYVIGGRTGSAKYGKTIAKLDSITFEWSKAGDLTEGHELEKNPWFPILTQITKFHKWLRRQNLCNFLHNSQNCAISYAFRLKLCTNLANSVNCARNCTSFACPTTCAIS